MITLPAGARILLATRPVDFRKGAHSLAALAAEMMGEDPFSGVVLVFRSKRADCVFRRKAAGDSDASQPVNPTQASHPFRGKAATPERV
jgi:transposase